jgi:hypothetical protein
LFDPDPAHPWNRLHAVFYVRQLPGGGTYTHAGPDAPFGREGPFLVEGPTHKAALAALDTFLKERHDERVASPLKRAVMYRDLWYVFDKLAEPPVWDHEREPLKDRQAERRQVQKRLAQVMRRLELSADQIKKLPDTYAAAVKAGTYPAAFDPKQPERAFLPPDLKIDGSGNWVPVTGGKPRELAAPRHAKSVDNKAAFAVFLRLPDGREATKAFVREMPSPSGGDFPRLPDGSRVALVRRLLLPDRDGGLRPTAVVESVQVRVFPKQDKQLSFEFDIDRGGLLAGKSPLRATGPDEGRFFGFEERGGYFDPLHGEKPVPRPSPTRCAACHPVEKGASLFTFGTFGFTLTSGYMGASVADVPDQLNGAIELKKRSYSWGLLQGLRETSSP